MARISPKQAGRGAVLVGRDASRKSAGVSRQSGTGPVPGDPQRTFVFLGPSLPIERARALLPAVYVGPAGCGDIYRLARWQQPQTIVLIDGTFEGNAAVWHKELLYALSRGIRVLGASSMGALRAAELHSFGMEGSGWVYQQYVSSALTADDEVAVAHLPRSHGYRPTSLALVHVRYALERAGARGLVTSGEATRVVQRLASVFYRERTAETLAVGLAAVKSPARRAALAAFLTRPSQDIKQRDAEALLARLAKQPWRPPALRGEPALQTWAFRQLQAACDGELG